MALEKITQVDAATKARVTQAQGRISQIAAKYGGCQAYKQLLAAIFYSTYAPNNSSEPLDESQGFIALHLSPTRCGANPPPDAVQAVVDCIQAYGWRVFQAILAATSIETRGRLLAALVSGLPQGLLKEFRGLAGLALA